MPEILEKEQTNAELNEKKEIDLIKQSTYDELMEYAICDEFKQGLDIFLHRKEECKDDPLIRVLSTIIDKEADTQEAKTKLWEMMISAISLYMAFEDIRKKEYKKCFAKQLIKDIGTDDYIGVKSVKDKKVACAVIPKNVISENNLDTDEKIIEFAKTMPNQFDSMQDGTFSVLTKDELESELNNLREKIENGGEEECQN